MSVLKYKDNLGNWVSIPTIKGDKGDKGDAGTTSWSGITDKPTTIAGFGITDAYTKTETDTLLGAKADTSTTYTKTETDTALATKESTTNKVTALSSASTDTQYPSAKCVYDANATKQDTISDLETIRTNASAVSGKENIGKMTIGGTEYSVITSTTDSGTAGYITFVLEA